MLEAMDSVTNFNLSDRWWCRYGVILNYRWVCDKIWADIYSCKTFIMRVVTIPEIWTHGIKKRNLNFCLMFLTQAGVECIQNWNSFFYSQTQTWFLNGKCMHVTCLHTFWISDFRDYLLLQQESNWHGATLLFMGWNSGLLGIYNWRNRNTFNCRWEGRPSDLTY